MDFIEESKYRDEYGIYAITNLDNGKQYIGQTGQSFIRRYWHHQWKLNDGSHDNRYLQAAWNKHGADAFSFSVLKSATQDDNLDELEKYYIDNFNSYTSGYNMTTGGDGKRDCPMSDHAKSIVGAKNREHMIGRKASEATRRKMRESSRHTPCTEEHKEILRRRMTGREVSESTRKKLRDRFGGSNSPSAKINEATAAEIKMMLINGKTQMEISNQLDISYGIISSIRCGRAWVQVEVDGWDDWMNEHRERITNKKR